MEKRFWKIYSQDVKMPESLARQVAVVSCLAYSEKQQVYLTENIRKQKFILKAAQDEKVVFLRKDARMLREHPFSFLPEYILYEEEDRRGYLLREYIQGDTLWELVNKQGPLGVPEAGDMICRLCDMAGQLHGQDPPIIHRDIKPQNIVLTAEKNLFLIDLGTVRNYNKDMNQDTVFVGTKLTAAPEQYGYRQTDGRADIYALGILYLFLLTGSLNAQEPKVWEGVPASIRRIIWKCTKMDPDDRYQTCEELKRAVARIKEKGNHLPQKLTVAAAGATGMLAAKGIGFFLKVYSQHTKRRQAAAIMEHGIGNKNSS